MRRGHVATLSGIGVAALLALPPATAEAAGPAPAASSVATPTPGAASTSAPAPSAGSADVMTNLTPSAGKVAPGGSFTLSASAVLLSGEVPELGFTLTLPAGVEYRGPGPGSDKDTSCTLSSDGRSITCMGAVSDRAAAQVSDLAVDKGLAQGTVQTFTLTAIIGDAVDSDPTHATATTRVVATTGADWGLRWVAPTKPVRTGTTVDTELVLTNYGPGADTHWVYLDMTLPGFPNGAWGVLGMPPGCMADSGSYTCQTAKPVAAGSSVTYTFRWTFLKAAAGKTFRVPTSFVDVLSPDPDPSNDSAVLKIALAEPSGQSSASPSPSPSTPAAAPGTGGGQLADTGANPMPPAATGAAALLLGGALLECTRRMRRGSRSAGRES